MQQQQPTPGPDTRSPRGGLKDAVGSVVDGGGRTAPGPAEGLNVGVGVKESSGVNGSGGPPPSKRQVGCFLSCLWFGELWECVYYRRRTKALLWVLERERELREGRVEGPMLREDRVLAREGLVMRARVRRGRRVWAVMRPRRRSGGGDRWVGGGFAPFFFFFVDPRYLQVPERYVTRVDWYMPRWCVVLLPWSAVLTCERLD